MIHQASFSRRKPPNDRQPESEVSSLGHIIEHYLAL